MKVVSEKNLRSVVGGLGITATAGSGTWTITGKTQVGGTKCTGCP